MEVDDGKIEEKWGFLAPSSPFELDTSYHSYHCSSRVHPTTSSTAVSSNLPTFQVSGVFTVPWWACPLKGKDTGYRGEGDLVEFMAVGVCGSDSYIPEETAESLQQNCLAISLKA